MGSVPTVCIPSRGGILELSGFDVRSRKRLSRHRQSEGRDRAKIVSYRRCRLMDLDIGGGARVSGFVGQREEASKIGLKLQDGTVSNTSSNGSRNGNSNGGSGGGGVGSSSSTRSGAVRWGGSKQSRSRSSLGHLLVYLGAI
jgi:hypothetical protein